MAMELLNVIVKVNYLQAGLFCICKKHEDVTPKREFTTYQEMRIVVVISVMTLLS